MAVKESATLITQDAVRDLARQLDCLEHGERGKLIASFCEQFGWSTSTGYRKLKEIGWNSKRKTRSDKGSTSQDMDVVNEFSSLLKNGIRKNGKATMHTPVARSVLGLNGRDVAVSNSRINTLLKRHQMNLASHRTTSPSHAQKSLYPNHVHLVDPSLCLLYYLPDGKQKSIKDDEAYKNKPETIEKLGKLKVWRYVLTDHYSNTIIVKYYQSKGETQANLFDFLLYCWQKQKGRPFHGVPDILYWDKGSANTAKAIKNALSALAVTPIEHEAGNARAKGSVEKANDLVETKFESLLKSEPVKNIEELNFAVEAWCHAYNQNLIPNYDSRLKRQHMAEPKARFDLWQTIHKTGKLRELPDVELCRYLLSSDPVERKVQSDLSVSFKHPSVKKALSYYLGEAQGIYKGQTVRVSPLMFGNLEVLVHFDDYNGEEQTFKAEPTEYDEVSGFAIDAAIIGQEMKSKPDTQIEQAAKLADKASYPGLNEEEIKRAIKADKTPFNGDLKTHSHFSNIDHPIYIPRQGSEISIPNHAEILPTRLSPVAICRKLVAEVGKVADFPFHPWVKENYPDGIAEAEFNTLVEHLKQDMTDGAPDRSTGLKLVAHSTHQP